MHAFSQVWLILHEARLAASLYDQKTLTPKQYQALQEKATEA